MEHQEHQPTPLPKQESTMSQEDRHHALQRNFVTFALGLSAASIFGLVLLSLDQYQEKKQAQAQAKELFTRTEQLEENISAIATDLVTTQEQLQLTMSENSLVLADLTKEQERLKDDLVDELDRVSDTVGDLEKLSQTDKQLLQKYSKVFFLNEHYAPPRLKVIPDKYVYDEDRVERIDERVWPHLEDLLEDAKDDGIELFIKSGYRSFEEQRNTKAGYTVTYGAGTANTFSADQGYSEHQLGTTIDFITTGIGGSLDGFQNTEAYIWLQKNAYKYGFVLSYPEGNQYYVFEPWHWRFVGEDLSDDLHDDKEQFYDLDQRAIDKYLLKMFD